MKPWIKTAFTLILWLGISSALTALFFALRMGFVMACVWAFLIILASARLQTLLWLRHLVCARSLSGEVVQVGDAVQVTVRISNPWPWPILWVYAEENLPPRMPVQGTHRRLLFLPPRGSTNLFYSITLTRRGCHQLGPLVVETGDIFGLFRKSRVDRIRHFVTATPLYEVIEDLNLGQARRLGNYSAKRSLFEDPTRIAGVREYRRGDPLKRIHWKSTAHTGELHSRVYEAVTDAGATVILDFRRDAWTAAHDDDPSRQAPEIALETACSICRYLWDGGWKVGFLSNGRDPLGLPGITLAQARASDTLSGALEAARMGRPDDRIEPVFIPARRGADQFFIIHENLGRLTLSDGLRIEEAMADALPHIEREQVLVLLTGQAGDAFVEGVLRARALGYRVMVFIVRNTVDHDTAFEAFVPHGIEVFDLEHERRLTEIATGRRYL